MHLLITTVTTALYLVAALAALSVVRSMQRRWSWGAVGIAIGATGAYHALCLFDVLREPEAYRAVGPPEVTCLIASGALTAAMLMLRRHIRAGKEADRRLLEASAATERKLRVLVEGLQTGVLIHRGHRPLFVNTAYARYHGYTVDELMAMESLTPIIAEADRKRLIDYAERRIAGDEAPERYQYRSLRKDGTTGWLDMCVRVVDWEGGPAIQCAAVDISEQKAAVFEVQRQRDELEMLLDATPMMIFYKDTENNLIRVNRAAAARHGVTPEQMANTPDARWSADSADRHHEDDLEVILTRAPKTDIVERVAGAGGDEQRWFRTDKYPLLNAEGQVEGVVGFSSDITAQKLAEEALRRSERRYRSLVDSLQEGVVMQDATGRVVASNPSACRILGMTEDQLRGRAPRDPEWRMIHEDGSEFAGQDIPAMVTLRTGRAMSDVIMGVHKPDGSLTWVSSNTMPIGDDGDAAPSAVITSITDITERRRAERALAESERRHRSLVEFSPYCIHELDLEGRFLSMSPTGLKMAGLRSEDEVIGRSVFDRASEDSRASMREWFERARAGQTVEFDFTTPNGRRHAIIWRPIRDERGNVVRIMGINRDTTEKRVTERALRGIFEGISPKTGQEFFESLARHLAAALDMRWAIVGELCPDNPGRVRAMAFWSDDHFEPAFEYELAGTPCQGVLSEDLCIYRSDVVRHFPDDADLHRMGAESYAGIPLIDSAGNRLGILALVHDKPIENDRLVEAMLRLFAARAAAELERDRIDRQLVESSQRLIEAQKVARMGFWDHDLRSKEIYWSNEVFALFGLDANDSTVRTEFFYEHVHPDDREDVVAAARAAVADHTEFSIDHRIILPGGAVRWVNEKAETLYDDAGEPIRMVGTVIDITERKEVELAAERRSRRFAAVNRGLIELAGAAELKGADLDASLRLIVARAADLLEVRRTGIWLFSDEQSRLDCHVLLRDGTIETRDLPGILTAEFPTYFGAMMMDRIVAAGDARNDPRTAELVAPYLEPLGVGALLDAAVRVKDKIVGVLCFEHIGGARDWSDDEQAAAGSLADLVALVIESHQRIVAEQALREVETRLNMLAAQTDEVIWITELDPERITYVSPAIRKVWGQEPERVYADARAWIDGIHADDRARVLEAFEAWLSGERDTFNLEYRVVRPDGTVRWVDDHGTRLHDDDGRVKRVGGIARDITARKLAEKALGESEQRYQSLAEAAPVGILRFDARGRCIYANRHWERLSGLPADHASVNGWLDAVHPDDRERVRLTWRHASRTSRPCQLECRLRQPDGAVAWLYLQVAPERGDRGSIGGFVATLTDITERKRAEQRRKLLMRELDHRVKNNLASVISLVSQTTRTAKTMEQFTELLEGRIQAMARAHEALAQTGWGSVEINDIVRKLLKPYIVDSDRIAIEGPDAMLSPQCALPICLAIHELAVNAVKHGSLSRPSGRVDLRWRTDSGLHLDWVESGGPEVKRSRRRGSGLKLIEGLIGYELRGTIRMAFDRSGLTCQIAIPNAIQTPTSGAAQATGPHDDAAPPPDTVATINAQPPSYR